MRTRHVGRQALALLFLGLTLLAGCSCSPLASNAGTANQQEASRADANATSPGKSASVAAATPSTGSSVPQAAKKKVASAPGTVTLGGGGTAESRRVFAADKLARAQSLASRGRMKAAYEEALAGWKQLQGDVTDANADVDLEDSLLKILEAAGEADVDQTQAKAAAESYKRYSIK